MRIGDQPVICRVLPVERRLLSERLIPVDPADLNIWSRVKRTRMR